nr:hypothetical protein [Desulfobacterales bacterium]
MEIANAAPLGVLAFGVSCLVSGLFFMGVDTDPPESTTKTVALTQIMCGVTLFIVTILFLLGSKPVNATFAMWAACIFGFFAYVWILLGWTLLRGGDLKPLSSFLIYTCVVCIVYMIHSFQLKATSFGILFIFATIGTFLAWIGIRGWWGQGVKLAGVAFFILGFIGLYIGLWEMLTIQSVKVLLGG